MSGLRYTSVKAHFSAAHRRPDGAYHGHTWTVWARWPAGYDAIELQRGLRVALRRWDESQLPDELWSGEALAEAIGTDLGCVSVRLIREAEGIEAEWIA